MDSVHSLSKLWWAQITLERGLIKSSAHHSPLACPPRDATSLLSPSWALWSESHCPGEMPTAMGSTRQPPKITMMRASWSGRGTQEWPSMGQKCPWRKGSLPSRAHPWLWQAYVVGGWRVSQTSRGGCLGDLQKREPLATVYVVPGRLPFRLVRLSCWVPTAPGHPLP